MLDTIQKATTYGTIVMASTEIISPETTNVIIQIIVIIGTWIINSINKKKKGENK